MNIACAIHKAATTTHRHRTAGIQRGMLMEDMEIDLNCFSQKVIYGEQTAEGATTHVAAIRVTVRAPAMQCMHACLPGRVIQGSKRSGDLIKSYRHIRGSITCMHRLESNRQQVVLSWSGFHQSRLVANSPCSRVDRQSNQSGRCILLQPFWGDNI